MPAEPDITPTAATTLVERLRAVHLQMLDAVLTGDGLAAVGDLAADAAGGPVAIVVPRLGVAVASAGGQGAPSAARSSRSCASGPTGSTRPTSSAAPPGSAATSSAGRSSCARS